LKNTNGNNVKKSRVISRIIFGTKEAN